MSLPATLLDQVLAARSMLRRADFVNADIAIHNAKAMLQNARAYVVEEGDIGHAFDQALRDIGALQDVHDLDDWRTTALQSLDSLEQSLSSVRANDHAKALGMDW